MVIDDDLLAPPVETPERAAGRVEFPWFIGPGDRSVVDGARAHPTIEQQADRIDTRSCSWWGSTVPRTMLSPGPSLLELKTEAGGRRGKTYSLTDDGRSALREWLASPTNEHFQMRDLAELKLFFNEVGDPENVSTLAREQIAQHEERIAVYEAMVDRFGDDPRARPRMITLELGLEMEYAALRFWTALADGDLERLRRQRALTGGGALAGVDARSLG